MKLRSLVTTNAMQSVNKSVTISESSFHLLQNKIHLTVVSQYLFESLSSNKLIWQCQFIDCAQLI